MAGKGSVSYEEAQEGAKLSRREMDAVNRQAKRRGTNTPLARLMIDLIQRQTATAQLQVHQMSLFLPIRSGVNRLEMKLKGDPALAEPAFGLGSVRHRRFGELTEENLLFQQEEKAKIPGKVAELIRVSLSNSKRHPVGFFGLFTQ